MTIQYPLPATPEDFESLCLRLYRKHWDVPNLQKYGRRRDNQSGGDLIGTDTKGRVCFIQCKRRDWDRNLRVREIEPDIEAARHLQPKVERYGIATTSKRDPRLQRYIAQKNAEHRAAGLFSVELDSWDDIVELLNQHPDVAESVHGSRSPGPQGLVSVRQEGTINVAITHIEPGDSIATQPEEKAAGRMHAEIDAAAKYLTENKPDTALEFLERLRKREWDRANDREKYRILANMGHAHRLLGQHQEAAQFYMQAKQFQPEDENARWIEALAHVLRGNHETAHKLANQAMQDFPEFTKATAVWVGSAPSGMSFEDIEKVVPASQRDDAEVAINLATQAARRAEWIKAEHYARTTLEKEPNWVETKITLAAILFQATLARRGHARFGPLDEKDRARVMESANLLSSAIQELPSYEGAVYRAGLLVNLAGMYQLLGQEQQAGETIVAAHSTAPDDAEIQMAYASHLTDTGRLDDAISLLRSFDAPSPKRDLILAQALVFRKRERDQQDAIELLRLNNERLAQIDEQPPDLRIEWARTLLDLHLSRGENAAATSILSGRAAEWLRPEERLVWEADAALASGDKHAAAEKAKEALKCLSTDSHPVTRRQLARTLHRLGFFAESLDLWREVTTPDHVSQESDYLLDCALRTGHDDITLDFCRRLREAGVYEPRYIRNELAILCEASPLETLDVLNRLLEVPLEEAFKRELRASRSYLALQMGKTDLVVFDPEHLPSLSDLEDARTGRLTVEVLRHGPDPLAAVRYAYEVFRKFPDDQNAHEAVIASFLESELKIIAEPDSVKAGIAVKYKEEDSGRETWVIIEDSLPPRPALGEQAPDTPVARALIGKGKGDLFVLREHPRRTGVVLKIVDKYVHRFRQCISEMETRFPGSAHIISMHTPLRPDGTPDAEKTLEQMKEVIGDPAKAERFYQDNLMPMHTLGRYTGGSVFEAVQRLAGRNDMTLKCCLGIREERETAFAAIRTASEVVLDESALATLYLLKTQGLLNIAEFLEAAPYKYILSEHTLTALRGLRQLRSKTDGDQLLVEVSGDKTAAYSVPAEQVKREKENLEQFIGTLESCCSVAPGIGLVARGDVDKKTKEAAEQLLGKAGLDSTLLATMPGRVLWTDDLATAVIVCPGLGVRRAWTQAVVFWLAQQGRITTEQEQGVTTILLRCGYVFTSLRPDHIIAAGDEAGWDADAPGLQSFFSYFGHPSLDLPSRFGLARRVLKELWQRNILHLRAEQVTFRILAALRTVRKGRRIIDALLQHADSIFGLDVMTAQAFRQAVQTWLQTNRSIVLP